MQNAAFAIKFVCCPKKSKAHTLQRCINTSRIHRNLLVIVVPSQGLRERHIKPIMLCVVNRSTSSDDADDEYYAQRNKKEREREKNAKTSFCRQM